MEKALGFELANGAVWEDDLEKICDADEIAFDFEYDPDPGPHDPDFRLWGCSFASDNGVQYCQDHDRVVEILRKHLSCPEKTWIAHNAVHEAMVCGVIGVQPKEMPEWFADTMLGMNTLYDYLMPNQLGLKGLIYKLYGYEMTEFEDWELLDPQDPEYLMYPTDDVIWTLQLWRDMKEKLEDEGQMKYFKKVLGRATVVFGDLQRFGMLWDDVRANQLTISFSEVAAEAESRVKKTLGNFNVGSPKQVSARLFEDADGARIPTGKIPKTDSGKWYKTDDKTLAKLANKHPVCRDILAFRTANKQISSYLSKYSAKAYDDPYGRIRAPFWLSSATGRTRAGDSLQAVPARFKGSIAPYFEGLSIRECFRASPGFVFIGADFSQIELRLIAQLTKEPAFYDAYMTWDCTNCGKTGAHETLLRVCPACGATEESGSFFHGRDLHQEQADSIPEVQGNRSRGKILNFSLSYNVGTNRLYQEDPSLTYGQWDHVRDVYLSSKPRLTRWHETTCLEVHKNRCLRDMFGRKRRFRQHEFSEKHWWHTKNQAINFRPQSSACSLCLLAMIAMRNKWVESGDWVENVRIVHMVHDELLVEARKGHEERLAMEMRDCMEYTVNVGVPIRADYTIGNNWKECK